MENESCSWFVLKVDAGLDWTAILDGARLTFSPHLTLSNPKSPDVFLDVQVEDGGVQKLVPLKPASPATHKFIVAGMPTHVLRVMQKTEQLKKMEKMTRRAVDDQNTADRARAAMAARRRAEVAVKRAEIRKRLGLGPLKESLEALGLPSTGFEQVLAEDTWDGFGDIPVDVTSRTAEEEPTGEGVIEEPGTHFHVKTFDPDVQNGECVPLVTWPSNRLLPSALSALSFKRFVKSGSSRQKLFGPFRDAATLKLSGERAKASPAPKWRYLVGAQVVTSKRIFFCEAQLYRLRRLPPPAAEPTAKLGYMELRNAAVQSLGVAKKQREQKKRTEQREQKRSFMDVEKHTSALEQRAQELGSKVVSVEERDQEIRLKTLPTFSVDATSPKDIYKSGLKEIAPSDLIANEPGVASSELVEILTTNPSRLGDRHKLLRSFGSNESIPSVLQSSLCLAVLDARLKQSSAKLDEPQAIKLAGKLGVLRCLALLYSQAGRRFGRPTGVENVAHAVELTGEDKEDLRSHSRGLAWHWHQTYFDEIPGERKFGKRAFNGTKLMMAIVIWALHLTPELSLSTSREVESELGVNRDFLKEAFKYVGCTVQAAGQQVEAKLESVPKFSAAAYHRGGARKKRRAG